MKKYLLFLGLSTISLQTINLYTMQEMQDFDHALISRDIQISSDIQDVTSPFSLLDASGYKPYKSKSSPSLLVPAAASGLILKACGFHTACSLLVFALGFYSAMDTSSNSKME